MKKIIISIILVISMISLIGCSNNKDVVATVDGEKVYMSEYNYYYSLSKLQAEQSVSPEEVSKYWETEIDGKTAYEVLKENAYNEMLDLRITAKHAEKLGITYDDEVLNLAKQFKSQLLSIAPNESEFYKLTNTNDEAITAISKLLAIRNKMIQQLMEKGEISINEEEIKKSFNENYLKAQHILFVNTDEQNNPLSEETMAEKRKKAEEVLKRAKSGEDFTTLMNEFSEDPGSKSQPEGYVFTSGEMVAEFEDGTRALQINEISGIVESYFGYHIIKRLPLSSETDNEAYQTASQNLQSDIIFNYINSHIEEWKKDIEIIESKDAINKLSYK